MVLTTQRRGALLAACGAIALFAGAPRHTAAQEPPALPTPAVPPPRFLDVPMPARAQPAAPAQGTAWIGIGLACSRCSYQSEGKTIRRWSFSEPPAVTMVDRGSPADQAGLRDGDTLIAVEGRSLVSAEGGEAFANLRPGRTVRLTYRRDGRERTVSVTPARNPLSSQMAAADSQYRAAMRAYERSSLDAQREMARTQMDRQRAQRELERVQDVMRRNRGKVLDSASTRRLQEALEQAQRALETQRGYSLFTPSYPLVAPVAPFAPVAPVTPTPTTPPAEAPVPAPPGVVARSGALRYTGRLGEAVIEARRPGRVTVTETGDSEVVLTGGDLSVRVALSPSFAVSRAVTATPTATAGFSTARSASGDEVAGIQGVVANPRLAAALGASSGVLVLDVRPRSYADSLGVRPGDVLVSVNGNPVVAVGNERTARKRLRTAAGIPPEAQSAVVVRARERRTLVIATSAGAPPRRLRR